MFAIVLKCALIRLQLAVFAIDKESLTVTKLCRHSKYFFPRQTN